MCWKRCDGCSAYYYQGAGLAGHRGPCFGVCRACALQVGRALTNLFLGMARAVREHQEGPLSNLTWRLRTSLTVNITTDGFHEEVSGNPFEASLYDYVDHEQRSLRGDRLASRITCRRRSEG